MRLSPRKLRRLVKDATGLGRLVALGVEESHHVDFKATLNHRDPQVRAETRADCAALATAGEGYLVIGVEESQDGYDRAVKLIGLDEAQALDLRKSLDDTLSEGIDPPVAPRGRQVELIALEAGRVALVVHLRGRRGYPKSVVHKDGELRFVVRDGARKKWLTPAEARVRRRELDLLVAGVAVLVLVSVLALVFQAVWVRPLRAQIEAQAGQTAAQERRLAPRRLKGRTVPKEMVDKMRARQVQPVEVTTWGPDPETAAFAEEIWSTVQEIGFAEVPRRPGVSITPDRHFDTEVQSVENAPDDPLRVFADWLRGEGFPVTFTPGAPANLIIVAPRG